MHVGQTQIKALFFEQRPGGCEIRGGGRDNVHPAKGNLQQLTDVGFIIDDECTFVCHAVILSGWANVIRKQLPPLSCG